MVLNFYNHQSPGEIKFGMFSAQKVQTVIINAVVIHINYNSTQNTDFICSRKLIAL